MPFEYSSDELEAMACASNYYRWIIRRFRPYLSGRVLELGAGSGTFSSHLLGEPIERLVLIEPAGELCGRLRERFRSDPRVEVWHGVLEDVGEEHGIDVLVSVNVLEHIPDDVRTVHAAYRHLNPGGFLLLFVPALPFLYGPMDRTFGHLRRYTRATLQHLLEVAGFSVHVLQYANLLGMIAWWVSGRVLRRHTITPRMVAVSDRTLVPVTVLLEQRFSPPLGQSLIAVARKPSQ